MNCYVLGRTLVLNTGTREVLVGWFFPPDQWVKTNVDGCVRPGLGMAACGGVLGHSLNVLMEELWGIFIVLTLA